MDLDDDLERGAPRAGWTVHDSQRVPTVPHTPAITIVAYIYIYMCHSNGPSLPVAHYAEASTCDGIAVTAYNSIQADYVLDNVCLVQT